MEKTTVTKKLIEFLQIEGTLKEIVKAPGVRFRVIVAKNLKILSSELEPVKARGKLTPEFEKVLKAYDKLKEEYTLKTSDGKPQRSEDGRGYIIDPEKKDALQNMITRFWEDKDNDRLREEQNVIRDEYEKFLVEEDQTMELYLIPDGCIPEEYFEKEENTKALGYFVQWCSDLIC
jgi:hypothetical protein